MSERRKWKAEEKLAIIKEIEDTGKIIETCRKYSISTCMYYKLKDAYNIYVLDWIKPHKTRIGYDVRKIKSENERLKKLLAEKELENAMLSEALKKRWGGNGNVLWIHK